MVVKPSSAAAMAASRSTAAPFNISPPAERSAICIPLAKKRQIEGSVLAYLRAEVIAMPQKSNNPGNDPRTSVPQDQDDELEMAEDDEEFEDEDDMDEGDALEEDEVEE